MTKLPVDREDIISRLKKVEGQIRGIQKMVGEERNCVEIITQLAAANSALQSTAGLVLQNYTSICLQEEEPNKIGEKLAKAVSIWIKGRS